MRFVSISLEKETDITWNFTSVAIWSTVEVNLAIVSGTFCARFQSPFDGGASYRRDSLRQILI